MYVCVCAVERERERKNRPEPSSIELCARSFYPSLPLSYSLHVSLSLCTRESERVRVMSMFMTRISCLEVQVTVGI